MRKINVKLKPVCLLANWTVDKLDINDLSVFNTVVLYKRENDYCGVLKTIHFQKTLCNLCLKIVDFSKLLTVYTIQLFVRNKL